MAQIDIGMEKKMNIKCFKDICLLEQNKQIDETQIHDIIDFVNHRYDCADFRMLTVLKTYYSYLHLLSEETKEALKNCILNFKYWMDEPGEDGMCYWSENHQIIFHTCEYLAGHLFPNEVFTNNHTLGLDHIKKAETKIIRWLDYRMTYGFIEWHSNTYYEEDIAPLCLLVDHSKNTLIVDKAKIVLDLLFLDFALHSFDGRFVATSGRCYEKQKQDSTKADVNDILQYAFGFNEHYTYDYQRISTLLLLCKNYQVPPIIKDIAHHKDTVIIKNSMGLNLKEIKKEFNHSNDIDDVGMYLWAMESFTNPESINMTMNIFNAWKLENNNFLGNLKMINRKLLRKLNLLPLLVKILNPATQGVSIQRANTYTYKNKYYMLSSAQNYHPQEFGDQQHIWQASLKNNINVFSTHPGVPMFDDAARNFSPSYWVGNGINPHVVQNKNIVLGMYNLNCRKGFLERKRQLYIHFYFPTPLFSQVKIDKNRLFGEYEGSYIAILSTGEFVQNNQNEFIVHGKVTHFACIMGDRDTYSSLAEFIQIVSQYQLSGNAKKTVLIADEVYQILFKKDFKMNNTIINTEFDRYDTPYVKAPRKPDHLEITFNQRKYHIDFKTIQRIEE